MKTTPSVCETMTAGGKGAQKWDIISAQGNPHRSACNASHQAGNPPAFQAHAGQHARVKEVEQEGVDVAMEND